MRAKQGSIAIALLILTLAGAASAFVFRVQIRDLVFKYTQEPIPKAVTPPRRPESPTVTPPRSRSEPRGGAGEAHEIPPPLLPLEFNLAVPFTPQAPHANWDQPYQDGCEEAAALMVHFFYTNRTFTPDIADDAILAAVAFEDRRFGFNKDTNAEQTATFIRELYGYKNVDVVYDITVDDVKRTIASGFPVIVPAYGRALGNPFFTPPGPEYHMLVIKGYTRDKFITNDPGTRRGADFLYPYETLLSAVHDWNGGDVQNGRKVMIVVKPN
ncbi:MAG: C39 family peptidase [Patescibacteria group bacterium]